jgi:hypothetical protein
MNRDADGQFARDGASVGLGSPLRKVRSFGR